MGYTSYSYSCNTLSEKIIIKSFTVCKTGALMVQWHPVPVANQLLILITKLATYLCDYNIRYSYYSLSKFGGIISIAQ